MPLLVQHRAERHARNEHALAVLCGTAQSLSAASEARLPVANETGALQRRESETEARKTSTEYEARKPRQLPRAAETVARQPRALENKARKPRKQPRAAETEAQLPRAPEKEVRKPRILLGDTTHSSSAGFRSRKKHLAGYLIAKQFIHSCTTSATNGFAAFLEMSRRHSII